jgi:hypothetical protein
MGILKRIACQYEKKVNTGEELITLLLENAEKRPKAASQKVDNPILHQG